VVLGLGALWLTACGVVDVGDPTGPPAGCNAPAAYFLSDVWPRYFGKWDCGRSDCHDASSGHGFFRLQSLSGVMTPAPGTPLANWPTEWRSNLKSVQRNVSCANPLSSLVLVVPSGRGQPHPPGVTVGDIPDADLLFQTWLK
jgi:hypothetical protein